MIPDTAAALLAFLGLVAPGLAFELSRERRRPHIAESAFREASRAALTSLIFTVASLLVLIPLARSWPGLIDLDAWIADTETYVEAHYVAVARFLLLEVLLACGLALIAERATAGELRGHIVTGSVWYSVLRRDVPDAATRTWVWVTTENGTQFKGPLRSYTPGEGDDRELALGGEPIKRLAPEADATRGWVEMGTFDAVVIPASDIRHFAVEYLQADGTPVRASAPRTLWQRIRKRIADLS